MNRENNVEIPAPTIADIVSQSGGEFDNNNQDFDILLTALGAAGLYQIRVS